LPGVSPAYSAANFLAPLPFAIHRIIARHPLAQAAKNMAYQRIAVLRPTIIHPFPIAARFH
jgi:hypothetical protein